MLKIVLIAMSLVFSTGLFSQSYNRGKKNIGFSLGAYPSFTVSNNKAFSNNIGYSLSAGVSKRYFRRFFPGINYRYTEHQPHPDLNSFKYHSVALPLHTKWPFMGIYLGKSKKYQCKGVNLSFIIGPEYSFNFKANDQSPFLRNEFFINTGIEVLPSKSGSSKSNQKWSFRIDVLYKYALFPYSEEASIYQWKGHLLGLQMSLFKHSVYKFSNM